MKYSPFKVNEIFEFNSLKDAFNFINLTLHFGYYIYLKKVNHQIIVNLK